MDKLALAPIVQQLMPEGKPDFRNVVKYPLLSEMAKDNFKLTALMLSALIKDFCSSYNVVRNMDEDQMIEASLMLIEDAGNFRMEDYVMMFSMAKKGLLGVKIMDRIDIDIINQMADSYFEKRSAAGRKLNEEEYTNIEASMAESKQNGVPLVWDGENFSKEKSIGEALTRYASTLGGLKEVCKNNITEDEAKKQIVKNSSYKNHYEKK